MVTSVQKLAFWAATGIATAVEGFVVYQQWPDPPLKVCASAELGELLAGAAKADAELRAALAGLRQTPGDAAAKEVIRREAAAAAAANEVARYKKRAQTEQKAAGSRACK